MTSGQKGFLIVVALAVVRWLPAPAAAQAPRDPVLIRGGSFVMGTPLKSVQSLKERYAVKFPGVFENEVPAHRVSISDFRLDRHEVTKAQFAVFVAARPEWRKAALPAALHNGHYLEDWTGVRYPDGQGAYPVVFVTWHAAQTYCRWAGGRLPSEAEWEFAARGGADVEFPWGDSPPSAEKANYSSSGYGHPVAVGSYPPNSLGLFDMAGNVWELLLDAWEERHPEGGQADPIAGGAVPDDQLLTVKGRRSIRGGSFGATVVNLRTRWRDSHEAANAVGFVGFRCAYPGARWRPGMPNTPTRARCSARLANVASASGVMTTVLSFSLVAEWDLSVPWRSTERRAR